MIAYLIDACAHIRSQLINVYILLETLNRIEMPQAVKRSSFSIMRVAQTVFATFIFAPFQERLEVSTHVYRRNASAGIAVEHQVIVFYVF